MLAPAQPFEGVVLSHPNRSSEFTALRALIGRYALQMGWNPSPSAKLCIYRFPAAGTFTKAPTFGVTMGIVLEGEKRLRCGNQEVTVRTGDVVTVTREAELSAAITRGPYLGVSLCFCPERVAEALIALAEAGGSPESSEEMPVFLAEAEPRLLDAFRRFVLATEDPIEHKMLAPLAERELLFHLLRSPAAAALRGAVGAGVDRQRVLEAMQFIRANATRSLSVAEIAKNVAMSPSHFAHRFRDVARISPMRYLREVRLENARLLLAGGRRVSEVATEVGFDSPSHFTREFKRRFGRPPSIFRPDE